MEPVARIPDPLREIEIPQYLSVTRLSNAGPCFLRAVAPIPHFTPGAIGPRAEFGNLAHALADLAITGRLGSGSVPAAVGEAFEYLLAQAFLRLSSSEETRPYADLRVGFTKREWEKRCYLAITSAQEVVKRRRTPTPGSVGMPQAKPLSLKRVLQQNLRSAAEVAFESRPLRIRGRIDLVDLDGPHRATISDFKSGIVADADGVVNDETSLQVRLYGLAVNELAPERNVGLRILGQNTEMTIPFEEAEKCATLDRLHEITDALPAGALFNAASLAVRGTQCVGCSVRPVCPAYRSSVGGVWGRKDNPFELPLDIAGTLFARDTQDDHYSLKLTDLAGRIVKIHRVFARNADTSLMGQRVWLFDLASIEARVSNTGWRHPQNFHQLALTPYERTAWTLRVFRDLSGT